MTILAAQAWKTNGDLIADVASLGYLTEDGLTLDPTYGEGNWWTVFRPKNLVCHDKYKLDGVDFTALPHEDDTFDHVAFDPPYVCKGGRATSGIKKFDHAYGLENAPKTPAALQRLIDGGVAECARVLRPGGTLLVKCQDYVSSGKLWAGTYHTLFYALRLLPELREYSLEMLDHFEHYCESPRPQPPGRRQVHARRNHSTLFVFKKR